MGTPTITIDLVPYEVEVTENGNLTILDCSGSILSKLDTDPKVTEYRFSEDVSYSNHDDQYFRVYYDNETGNCEFVSCDKTPLFIGLIAEWIAVNYERMNDIGWEMLEGD